MKKLTLLLITAAFILTSCGIYKRSDVKDNPVNVNERVKKNIEEGRGIRFGKKGIQGGTFDFASSNELWRASIDILDFVPFTNASYSGGIIITDWFSGPSKVENEKVILGLSGGVDSSVVAMLLHQCIKENLTCIFVDNGLLRLNEVEEVLDTFSEVGINVHLSSASDLFLSRLEGIKDPEQKRIIIGNTFIEVFEEEAKKIDNVNWLAQGTIYPDVIESSASETGNASVIKSHHNVGGLPEKMDLNLLEPLRDLFKDEVRNIGKNLGVPSKILGRHPFPGPGLAIRIMGEVKKERLDILRIADKIFIDELINANLYDNLSQAFVVYLPVKSVGVVGDARRYEDVLALRAVKTVDFMTATWADLPYDFIAKVSNRIVNEISQISRVVYDCTGKPPATIEWE